MKRIICGVLLLTTIQLAKAQKTITSVVKNEQGSPLHFVYIHDQKSPNAVFTDSLGNFSIVNTPGALYQFEAVGYRDTVLSGDKLSNAIVVLKKNGSNGSSTLSVSPVTVKSNPISSSYLANENISNASVSGGTLTGLAHQKGNVHGNRYLFDDFAHGFIVSPQGTLIASPTYMYDYDKMSGAMMLTVNNNGVTQISDDQIKYITLVGNDDKTFMLSIVPLIDGKHYVQVLATGKNYAIYKAIKTTFIKADFVNNGVTSHGNDYDEFEDDYTYYVWNVKTAQMQKLDLKKKSIKADFAGDAEKVNKFMTDHSNDTIDDTYLSSLGSYMNN